MNDITCLHIAKESTPCCDRCATKVPLICCDVCHNDQVLALVPRRNDNLPQRSRKPRQIKVSPFRMSTPEERLRHALYEWRNSMAMTKYVASERYGGDILLHHEVIDKIVGLAHEKKISTVHDLQTHTSWCFTPKYGLDIVDIIRQHCPPTTMLPSPFTNMPREEVSTSTSNSGPNIATKHSRASPTCSVCGDTGHRSKSDL